MPPEDTTPYENTENTSSASRKSDVEQPAATSSSAATPLGLRRSDRGGPSSTTARELGSSSSLPSNQLSSTQLSGAQADINQLIRQGLRELEQRRGALQREIEQLERRKTRIEEEMRSSFAGSSQDIAIRVQGFKEYLIGSLQDLATAAEQINLVSPPIVEPFANPAPGAQRAAAMPEADLEDTVIPLAAQRFAEQRDRIHSLLDQYRTRPDYYGPPWQLRRTFEPIHAERTANWFFTQSGRGALKSMSSRLQNVLVASAAISCLYALYDRRLCVLVLATTPERLGEWRRWLQDCLGIARTDFGTNRGVMLFESAEPMAQRAERLMDSGRLPFLIMDEAESKVSLSLLQYPLWLGFAPDPANPATDYDYY